MNDWKKKLKEIQKQIFPAVSSKQGGNDNNNKPGNYLAGKSVANWADKDNFVVQIRKSQKERISRPHIPKKPRTIFDPIYTGKAALDAYPSTTKSAPVKPTSRSKLDETCSPLDLNSQSRKLSNNNQFKQPDPWVKAGVSLQPEGIRNKKSQVYLGIDFGTSYTKIAIRTQESIFFPDWSGIHKGTTKYLLPSEISEMKDGSYFVGRSKNAKNIHTDLKQSIILEENNNTETKLALVAYLAWIMRYARAWLFKEKESILSGRDLIWNINIGCPTNTYDSSSTYKAYQTLGPVAWHLSKNESIDKRTAQDALGASFDPLDQLENFDYHPEFAAQIAGYVKSPQRKDGLHLLLDIGGGTLDFAIFNVHKNNYQDIYPIFSSKVSKLGTQYLMSYRFKTLQMASHEWLDQNGIPDTEQFSHYYHTPLEGVQKADKAFNLFIMRDIVDTTQFAKQHKLTRYDWTNDATVIVAGGGASLKVYQMALESALNTISLKHHYIEFVAPDDAINLEENSLFHRLSVAYGLTFESGEIRRSSEIEDIPQPRPVQRPDSDELYPR